MAPAPERRSWIRRSGTVAIVVAVLSAALAGCGGSDEGASDRPAAAEQRSKLAGADTPRPADFPSPRKGQTLQAFADSIGATGTQVGLATSVFTPGVNRVAFGILGEDNTVVYAPSVVYAARSQRATRIRGPYAAPADLLITEPAFRSEQAATEQDPFAAIYQATGVQLDRPGSWLLLVVSKVGADFVAAPAVIRVQERSGVPAVGVRAPRVETDTLASAGSIDAIDTRRPPDDMHQTSFADVVGKQPVALLFATPQLCQSRVCGPVVDIAAQLQERYGDRMTFIHQEVYVDNDPNRGLREPLRRFGLPTEPWLFTVGADGRIAARLEGSFGLQAFQSAIEAALR